MFIAAQDLRLSIVNINNLVYNIINVSVESRGSKMSDVNNLLDCAVNETSYLDDGEVFLLRDLFKGYEWNRISRNTRLLLGTLFLNRICTEKLDIEPIAKTSSGQQKYKIVRRSYHA